MLRYSVSLLLVFVAGVAVGCGSTVDSADCEGDSCTTCSYGGEEYESGESIPSDCGGCACAEDGSVICDAVDCSVGICQYEGASYEDGDVFAAGDGCNTCSCEAGGDVMCTTIGCGACTYAGAQYQDGDTFDALDGCNTCTCGADGSVGCTKVACLCDPASEWWREYAATSPNECAVIDYACPENTTAFSNDCGCGCEQSSECPQVFDCEPPTPCDAEQLLEQCPYSEIAL